VSYAWWQLTLKLVINVFLAAGAMGLLIAGWRAFRGSSRTRRSPRIRRSPKTLALASLGALVIGAASFWLTTGLMQPHYSEVSTPEHFSSDALGITLDAAQGWKLSHEGATLTAIRGASRAEDAPASLVLTSTVFEQETAVEIEIESFKRGLQQQGLVAHDSFQDSIAGQPAPGFVARGDRAQLANWMLSRGPRWALLVQCFTRDGSDARSACRPAMERLSLRTPTDLKATR
jgi:hypothetical protein